MCAYEVGFCSGSFSCVVLIAPRLSQLVIPSFVSYSRRRNGRASTTRKLSFGFLSLGQCTHVCVGWIYFSGTVRPSAHLLHGYKGLDTFRSSLHALPTLLSLFITRPPTPPSTTTQPPSLLDKAYTSTLPTRSSSSMASTLVEQLSCYL